MRDDPRAVLPDGGLAGIAASGIGLAGGDPALRSTAVSHDLSARAASRARWVAALLEGMSSQDPGAPDIIEFLESYATTAESLAPGAATPGADGDSPLGWLSRRYGLTPTEVDIVLLAGLPAEHEGMARTFRALHPSGEPHLSVGLLAQLVCPDHDERAALQATLLGGAAVRSGLVHLAPGATFFERSVVLADSVWPALHGHDCAWPAGIDRVDLPPSPPGLGGWLDDPAVDSVRRALAADDDSLLVLSCPDEIVTLSRLAALASAGPPIVAARIGPGDRGGLHLAALHAAVRRARLAVLLDAPGEGSAAVPVDVDLLPGPVIVVTSGRPIRPVGQRPARLIPTGPVTAGARRQAWAEGLHVPPDQAAVLAARHPVDPALIAVVSRDTDSPCTTAITAALRTRIGLVLPQGSELMTPRTGWDHLVLPAGAEALLREAVDRLRNQSVVLDDWGFLDEARANRGARLLFTGPPGVGKSLAAEVLAHELGVDLLVVDLAQVVSKWLGETEKNLSLLFDAAERSQAVLRFDEADALFASRTSVGDANDRYANLETAYLLQRLDRFDGLAILTTNLKKNMDRAVLRRMDAVVEIGLPDGPARRRLWQVHLPSAAPLDRDIDLDELAESYEMPGAWIRNAAIAAAFLAAARGSAISRQHLLTAVSREYLKASQPFPGDPECV